MDYEIQKDVYRKRSQQPLTATDESSKYLINQMHFHNEANKNQSKVSSIEEGSTNIYFHLDEEEESDENIVEQPVK